MKLSDNFRGILTLSKVIFVLLAIPMHLHADESQNSGPVKIDLARQVWQAKKGFKREYKNGFSKSDDDVLSISEFPIVPNQLFDIPITEDLQEFTLQTEFEIPREMLRKIQPLSLYMDSIGENWEIFLNGKSIKKEVHLSARGKMEIRRTIRALNLPLDSNIFHNGKNRLVFHLIGDGPATPISKNLDLGFYVKGNYYISSYNEDLTRNAEILNLCLNTIYVFFGLYHLLIFYRRRVDLYNLYFGLFSILLATYSTSRSSYAFEIIRDTTWITRIEYSSVALLPPLFLLFMHDYFYGHAKKDWIINSIFVSGLVLAVADLVEPFAYSMTTLRMWQFTVLPAFIYVLFFIGRAVYLGRRDAKAMAISIFFVVSIAAYDVIDSLFLHTGIRFTQFAYLLFVVSLTGILANRFIQLYKQSEDLNLELNHQKLELAKQKNAFFRFVPIQFLNVLGRDSAVDVNLGDSVLRPMSVVFSDIRSFTSISERMTPEENFEFINEYLSRMEPIIQRYGGFVDKFMGDAILALFSDEENGGRNSAELATQAAVEMQKELLKLNESIGNGNGPIRIGIGINTGPLMLGTVGTDARLDTTVIGDHVNLASRLEGLTVIYKTNIIISHFTYSRIQSYTNLSVRELDSVFVKGKSEPVVMYEVFESDPEDIKKQKEASLGSFSRAIVMYKTGSFRQALELFEEALRIFPEDTAAQIYKKRCQSYIETPPNGNWVGIETLLEK